ncbi:hypothetical protein SGLAM104S_08810 [Streptomyces glaucescens]
MQFQEPDGTVVGLVSAGVTTEHVGGAADRQLPLVLVAAAVGIAVATAGTALVRRRLLRQTHGLGPREMTRMYEHHDAVLHAVREGVLIIDGEGALLLANDEARRLLDLPEDAEGRARAGAGPRPGQLRSCWPPAGSPRTRSGWSRTGCWPSTSGPRTWRAARRAVWRPCATPPNCAPCPAGLRWHGNASTCCTRPASASAPASM